MDDAARLPRLHRCGNRVRKTGRVVGAAATTGYLGASSGRRVHTGTDQAAALKKMAGLIVAPRKVEPTSLELAAGGSKGDGFTCEVSVGGVVRQGSGVPTVAEKFQEMFGERELKSWDYSPWREGEAAVQLLQDLSQRPYSEVMLGARVNVAGDDHEYVLLGDEDEDSGKACMSYITHDLVEAPGSFSMDGTPVRFTDPVELTKTQFRRDDRTVATRGMFGISRRVLRAVFLDDNFAPDGETLADLAAPLAVKMESWSFYACPELGSAGGSMLNVSNRHHPSECPPEAPTTHFFAGLKFNGDPVGYGDVLICLEHVAGSKPLLERPIASIVMLAQRSGRSTHPWKPGDGGYYEGPDY